VGTGPWRRGWTKWRTVLMTLRSTRTWYSAFATSGTVPTPLSEVTSRLSRVQCCRQHLVGAIARWSSRGSLLVEVASARGYAAWRHVSDWPCKLRRTWLVDAFATVLGVDLVVPIQSQIPATREGGAVAFPAGYATAPVIGTSQPVPEPKSEPAALTAVVKAVSAALDAARTVRVLSGVLVARQGLSAQAPSMIPNRGGSGLIVLRACVLGGDLLLP
jgi:hypothetical protein